MSKGKQAGRRQIKAEIAQGKSRYILRRGILAWALPIYVFYLLLAAGVHSWLGKITFAQGLRALFPFTILLGLVSFGIGGYFVGRHHWHKLLEQAGPKYRARK